MAAGANPVRQVAVSRTPAPCAPSGASAMTENKGLKRTVRAIFLFLNEMSDIRGNELPKLSSFSSFTYARFLQKIHSLAAAPIADWRASSLPAGPESHHARVQNTELIRTARAILLFFRKIDEIGGNELAGINSLPSVTYVRFCRQIHSPSRTLRPRNYGVQPWRM